MSSHRKYFNKSNSDKIVGIQFSVLSPEEIASGKPAFCSGNKSEPWEQQEKIS